jgi:transcriptional regulator with XRE-family HTH domain
MKSLKEFVQNEITKRGFSAAEFARHSGVAKSTINNILNETGDYPRIQTLITIADYTGVSVTTLFNLTVGVDVVRAEAYLLAQRIMELPPEKQEVIFELLSGIGLKQVNSGS